MTFEAGPFATFDVWTMPPARVLAAVTRVALDRRPLRSTPGLRFFKLLGTGRGDTFAVRDANPRRWALFAVWDGAGALDGFEASAVARRWATLGEERWRVVLRPLRRRGLWSGRDPLAGIDDVAEWHGPVAALTRARIRPAAAVTFWRAVPPVAASLRGHDGLRLALAVGEAPLGVQGTLSVWDSADALTTFAYADAAHRAVVDRTPVQRWYAEELFARFAVLASHGTVDGRDPVAGATA